MTTPDAGADDSFGFDVVERDFVRRHLPSFDWVGFDAPSRRNALPVPLAAARVGLVVTAGAHLPSEPAAGVRGDIRRIPVAAPDIRLTHVGYDTTRAALDPEVVVPRRTLEALAADGTIGSVAPTVVSIMGFVPDGHDVLERSVPETVASLRDEGVDLALLVPS